MIFAYDKANCPADVLIPAGDRCTKCDQRPNTPWSYLPHHMLRCQHSFWYFVIRLPLSHKSTRDRCIKNLSGILECSWMTRKKNRLLPVRGGLRTWPSRGVLRQVPGPKYSLKNEQQCGRIWLRMAQERSVQSCPDALLMCRGSQLA